MVSVGFSLPLEQPNQFHEVYIRTQIVSSNFWIVAICKVVCIICSIKRKGEIPLLPMLYNLLARSII